MKLHLGNRRVAISGFEPAEAISILRCLKSAEVIASVVAPGPHLPGLNPFAHFDVCILNCGENGGAVSAIDQLMRSRRPILLIGQVDEVEKKMPEIVGVEHDFILRPFQPEELLLRTDQLITSVEAELPAGRRFGLRCVLIAEDEEVTNALIATILKGGGFECVSVLNGLQAIEIIKRKKPDVVLLDVLMPQLGGFDTLAALRRMPEMQDLPVIMLTGCSHENDIVRGFQLGAADYIVKPFNARELIARVDRIVCNAESRRAD